MDSQRYPHAQAAPEQQDVRHDARMRHYQWLEYSGYFAMGFAVLAFSVKTLDAVLPGFPFAIWTYIGILVFLFVAGRVGLEQQWPVTLFFGTLLRDLCKSCALFPLSLCSWASHFSRRMFSPTQTDGEVLLDLLGPFAQKLWKLIDKFTAAQNLDEHDERRPSLQQEGGHFVRNYNSTDQAESLAFWFTWIIALIGLFCTLKKYSSMSMDNVLTIILMFLIYLVLRLLAFTITADLPEPPPSPPATEGAQDDDEQSGVANETNKRCGNFRRLSINPHPNGDFPRGPRWGRRCSKNLSPVRLMDLKREGIFQKKPPPAPTSSPKSPKSGPTPSKPRSPHDSPSRGPHTGREYTGFYDARTNTHRSTDDKQPVRQEDPVKERKQRLRAHQRKREQNRMRETRSEDDEMGDAAPAGGFMQGIPEKLLLAARQARCLQMSTVLSAAEGDTIETIKEAIYDSLKIPEMTVRRQDTEDEETSIQLQEKSFRELRKMFEKLASEIEEIFTTAETLGSSLPVDQKGLLLNYELQARILMQALWGAYQQHDVDARERAQRDAELRLKNFSEARIDNNASPSDRAFAYGMIWSELTEFLEHLKDEGLVSQEIISQVENLIRECRVLAPDLNRMPDCRVQKDQSRGDELIHRLVKTINNGCLPTETSADGYLCSVRSFIMSLKAAGAFAHRSGVIDVKWLMDQCFDNFTGALDYRDGVPTERYQRFLDQDAPLQNHIQSGDTEALASVTRLSEVDVTQLQFMLRFLIKQGVIEPNYRLFVVSKTYADDGDKWLIQYQEYAHDPEEYKKLNLDNIRIVWLYSDNAEGVQLARLRAPYQQKGQAIPPVAKLYKDADQPRHIGHYQGFSTDAEHHKRALVQSWNLPGPQPEDDGGDEEL